eukprot:scaffold108641_cov23-Tisochrysis_lutea.AAC.1
MCCGVRQRRARVPPYYPTLTTFIQPPSPSPVLSLAEMLASGWPVAVRAASARSWSEGGHRRPTTNDRRCRRGMETVASG